jgi:hypothetical protein
MGAQHNAEPVMWNDDTHEWEPRARDADEAVDLRRGRKRLTDCTLPEGFRLLTPEPKQYWIEKTLVWGFTVAWGRVDTEGRRGADEYFFVARYEQEVADEFLMQWAIEDFSRELRTAGVDIDGRHRAKESRQFPDRRQQCSVERVPVVLKMRVA